MYINSLYSSRHLSCPFRILGIVDEDPSLQNLNVYGFRVLGTSGDLEALYKDKPFDAIVLTTVNIADKHVENIRAFAREHNIRVTMFLAQEYPADLDFFKVLQEKAINPFVENEPGKQDEGAPGHGS